MSTEIVVKKKREYVNNSDFLKALVQYKEDSINAIQNDKPKPRVPNYIGECFLKIANGLSQKPNFINYPFKDEMIADGVENCLMYFENFNPDKTQNPFAYFTQIIYYAFLRRIQKEKKQMYIKCKATEQMSILDEFELQELEEMSVNHRQFELYDNIAEFIELFEESKRKKIINKSTKGLDNFFEE